MLISNTREQALARVGRALADPTRCRLLLAVLDGVSYPAHLADHLELSRTNVSNHLACLRWCRMVEGRREGRAVRYRICDPRLERLLLDAEGVAGTNAGYLASCTRIGPDWV